MIRANVRNWVLGSVILGAVVGSMAFFFSQKPVGEKRTEVAAQTCPHDEDLFQIKGNVVTTPYGIFTVEDKVFFDLINSAAMQRIRKVHQFGIEKWIIGLPEYSRYTHCLGVWALLRRVGAPLKEQLAGLLHDASHTAFSHTGDYVFKHTSITSSYQDDIHEWFLRKYGVDKIVANYGIALRDVLNKNEEFTALERNLPDLCADRIEYNLHEGWQVGLITMKDVKKIVDDLHFEDEQWFFVSQDSAKKFGRLPFHFAQNTWGSSGWVLISEWAAEAIRRAIELHIITLDEFHFSTDDVIWGRLINTTDAFIKDRVAKMKDYKNLYTLVQDPKHADRIARRKFSGVDPLVKVNGELKRLTDLDSDFAAEYEAVKKIMQGGWKIKFLKSAATSSAAA